MHFDKAYIIGLPNHTNKRLDRCFKRFKREKVDVELWEGIYGLDVDINKYQKAGYLSQDFKLKLPGSLGCMLSHITLWEKLEKDSACDIAFICEDDILLNATLLKWITMFYVYSKIKYFHDWFLDVNPEKVDFHMQKKMLEN